MRQAILLLSTSFVTVSRLRAAIARSAEEGFACLCAGTVERARDLMRAEDVIALVLEPEDARGTSTADLVRESRRLTLARPVIALVRRAAGWSPASLALLGTRPDAVMVAEELDAPAVLRAIRPALRGGSVLEDVWPALEPDVPPPLRAIVRLALARADAPLPVSALAVALGFHRKTLWSHCRRQGVSSVQVLLMWCRLIAVEHALRTRPQSVERIANEMEFASPTALRNATRRYLGVTPTALRAGEAVACGRFRRWLRAARPAAARHGVTAGDAA